MEREYFRRRNVDPTIGRAGLEPWERFPSTREWSTELNLLRVMDPATWRVRLRSATAFDRALEADYAENEAGQHGLVSTYGYLPSRQRLHPTARVYDRTAVDTAAHCYGPTGLSDRSRYTCWDGSGTVGPLVRLEKEAPTQLVIRQDDNGTAHLLVDPQDYYPVSYTHLTLPTKRIV